MADVHVPAAAKPAIIGSAVTAWRDASAAIGSMPNLMGVAFAILLAANAAGALITPSTDAAQAAHFSLGLQMIGFGLGVVQSFLLAPVAIAVHRFVLLGEVTSGYTLNPSDQRFLRFFGFAVLLSALWTVPSAIMSLVFRNPDWGGMATAVSGLIFFIVFIVICIVSLRSVILFPAIALDAPGAQWRNALADSKGHSWRLLFILICTAVPAILVALPVYWLLLLRPQGLTLGSGAVYVAIQAIVQLPTLAAFAAAASRLFAVFAGRLRHPPPR
jgi:hypothetical protein